MLDAQDKNQGSTNKAPVGLAGWLEYIEAHHHKTFAIGLERVKKVQQALGLHPHFPCITVAGTNGKGSTCAMLERIYCEAGYQVGCYTSPHIVRYNERTRLNGKDADDEALAEALAAVEQARGEVALTYFEFSTLAAMWLFMRDNVDVAILEVGLGGRLDAVNVFDSDCALITSIDLDHMEYLGNTRELIGYEKAGVYRMHKPAICGDVSTPHTIPAHAKAIQAHYMQIKQAFDVNVHQESWDYIQTNANLMGLPKPALIGDYQINNAACVVAAIRVLQYRLPVSVEAIAQGLKTVTLRGRYQQVSQQPMTILDVAHNPHAACALADNLHEHAVNGKTIAIFAMLADKNIAGVIQALQHEINIWYAAGIPAARGASVEQLAEIFTTQCPQAQVNYYQDIISAYRQACLDADVNDRIIVFGSFYTVADVMSFLSNNPCTN